MITFLFAAFLLVFGYFVYSKFIASVFGVDGSRAVPSQTKADGFDFVELPSWKSFLIQFLNIAGTGPIFGAIAGAMWGANAFLWIAFGCVFAGAVHDFLIGMMSVRSNGTTVAELVGENLNQICRKIMIVLSAVLLLLVGVVFIASPADILANLTGMNRWIFIVIILLYYLLATVLPVDKVIGKVYPIFGIALLIMAVGIVFGMLYTGLFFQIPEFDFSNPHVASKSIFPYLFISIACGAISGFHATQAPIIARCIKSETEGRKVFYGAMITEGFVALIWAAAAMTFFGGLEGLAGAGSAPVVINKVSAGLMGNIGMVLAVLGVVACPITSGDTAFRALRLTIADAFKIDQNKKINRYYIVVPIFAIAAALLFIDFAIIWRYFSWSNQTLATFALWAGAAYLKRNGRNYVVALIPAMFMTVVVTSYILVAPEGFYSFMTSMVDLKTAELYGTGVGVVLALVLAFVFNARIKSNNT